MKTDALDVTRRFKDPIHDYIPFGPLVCSVIDTRHFQRLRNIKQLGVSYYVWPGASHNRFEHCLGVAYLARRMAEHLKNSQPSLGITDAHIQCIELAGLCHDLGHGPWSHVWDNMFIPKVRKGQSDKTWKHEDASEMMFDHMVKQYGLDISDEDVSIIKALISGDTRRCKLGATMPFLFEIVANKRNGIDVDKFDYIARDSNAIGERGNLSLSRLIHSARVIDNEICYDIKDANQIYELCYTRFSLHKRIYSHKTAKAIEYMIIDALLAAEPVMKIADLVERPDRYLFLTDEVLLRIEMSEDEGMKDAQEIIDRIRSRDLYRLVDFKVFSWAFIEPCKLYITPERLVEAAKTISSTDTNSELAEQLAADHVIVDLNPMHYGMQEKNPLDSVKFYSKHTPDICRRPEPGDISLLMPSSFGEVLLRVYTKDDSFLGVVQAAFREVLRTMSEHVPLETAPPASVMSAAPITETPPTPPPSALPSDARGGSRSLTDVTSPLKGSAFMDNLAMSPLLSKSRTKRTRENDSSTDRDAGSPNRKRRA
ncbi:hypothetical protein HYDPIDRAFT_110844 [Hydnomerulius pinastri MD-312]|nr:hypothetical protein HYDPIDRAFT_110844 [Hydnomerulius pinastri MD-312]